MRKNLFYGILVIMLLATLVLVHYYQPSEESIVNQVEKRTSELLNQQLADLNDFENQLSVYTNPFGIDDQGLFPKRVFINGGLVYWNDTKYFPEYSAIKQPDTLYTLHDATGLKIVHRREVVANRDLIEIFSVVPVVTLPPVTNQYLDVTYNETIFQGQSVEVSNQGSHQISYRGINLFQFSIGLQNQEANEWVELLLILLLIVTVLTWVYSIKIESNGLWGVTVLFAGRLILFAWSTLSVSSLKLFNPIYFTYGTLNYSLGDLALNALFTMAVIIVLYFEFTTKYRTRGKRLSSNTDYWYSLLAMLGQAVFAFFFYETVWLILEHSQVSLDISESIQFDELRVAGFLVVLFTAMSFLLMSTLNNQIRNASAIANWKYYLSLTLVACIGYLWIGLEMVFVFGLLILLTFIIDTLHLNRVINTIRYQSFIYLVLIFTFVSTLFSFSIYKHYEKDELIAKERFANRLLIRNDILGEYYLSQILDEIANDRYVRTRLLSRLLARQNIREKIKRQFLSSYFKKYDIDVYLFDAEGESLQDDNTQSYADWRNEFARDSLATDYQNIYFVEDKAENVRNKYVCFMDIEAYGRDVGHIVLDLTLKKYIPTSVFPELLLESKYYMGSRDEFDYGVFKNGEILYKQGRVTFENKLYSSDFKNPHLYEQGLEQDGYHYFGLKTSDGRNLIIVSPTYDLQATLSNFSFLFLIQLFSLGLVFVVVRVALKHNRFNLSTKIQLFLGLSFLLPMIVISIALINTLNTSYKEEIDRNFRKRSFNIAENLIDVSDAYFSSRINIDDYANEIAKAASLAQSDLNIYDIKGKLVTTSQPEIFRLGLLSSLLNPAAFYKIHYKREQNIITDQSIGRLDFKTSYTALRSYKDGRLLGVLAMPYFDSKNHLRRQQVEVFNNLVVIFSFIFLISLIGGNFIVGQLVKPLKKIGDRISKTSLQEINQPIQYDAQDEIGSLVKEYNKMLLKLEESKEALAVSQKESAWKEIARQVAHEIKNPLTPMRLKVQQLMRSTDQSSREYQVYTSLLTQVDSLSSIADSFSEFAKMPAPKPEQLDLLSLVENTLNLYHGEDADIYKEYELEQVTVLIDPKIFSRTLTNIILNAIQSVQSGKPQIRISVRQLGAKVQLAIADNGKGISEDQKEKIFTPYFSTKSTGSGIGLAVAKKGIENAGGNIWFESEKGEGTTFFITLPVYTTSSS
ncbi:ATP-binding protein [Marinoscillum sp.]|uniref:sensor histidine kinase n=1 Tax=Marinoscillum sp. TaxID=2024838 RepID=UPI003BAB1292